MDIFGSIAKWIDHDRYKAIAIVIIIGFVVGIVGCQVKAPSPITGEMVNESQIKTEIADETLRLTTEGQRLDQDAKELNLRIEAFNSKAKNAIDTIATKTAQRNELINMVGESVLAVATGGAITPTGVIGTVLTGLGILGLGTYADSKRKDVVIAEVKANPPVITPVVNVPD